MKDYPVWICRKCGIKYGRGTPENHLSTWHEGQCEVCGEEAVAVTEPRDFGHLKPEWIFEPKSREI